MAEHVDEAWVETGMDVATVKVDHLPVVVSATLPPVSVEFVPERNKAIADVSKLSDKAVVEAITRDIEKLEYIPWQVEASTHAHILGESLRTILKEHCPRDQRKPPPDWMAAATLEQVDVKRQRFRYLMVVEKEKRNVFLRLGFSLWKLRVFEVIAMGSGASRADASLLVPALLAPLVATRVRLLGARVAHVVSARTVKAAVRVDKAAFIDAKIEILSPMQAVR